MIEELKVKDLRQALSLVWKTFLEFEAPEYSKEGVKEFKRFIGYEKIKAAFLDKKFLAWVFRSEKKITGVIASSKNHIHLLFVHRNFHRKGIAKNLFNQFLEYSIENGFSEITVNSSPYAVIVYEKLGFVKTGGEEIKNGIRFYPMIFKTENLKNAN